MRLWGNGSILRERKSRVPREGIRHSSICKHGRASREELHEDGEGEHDGPASFPAGIEKYLCGGKARRGGQNRIKIIYAEAHGNCQHPTKSPGYEDCSLNGDWTSNGCIVGFFGHAIATDVREECHSRMQ